MKVMLLAAGLGSRMRPLSDRLPKPLLRVHGIPLLQYHLQNLAQAGYAEIIINHSRMGWMIEEFCGDGGRFGVHIRYSPEGEQPLETGGGILHAMDLLGDEPFVVVSADLFTDYDFSLLHGKSVDLAYLVLVDNPPDYPGGDFCLQESQVSMDRGRRLTYGNIGILRPELFQGCTQRPFTLGPLLHRAVASKRVQGEYFSGGWVNVGSPERLEQLNRGL